MQILVFRPKPMPFLKRHRLCFSCLFCLFFFWQNAAAQSPFGAPPSSSPADSNKVNILNAANGEFIFIKNELAKKLRGNVVLQQKDALLYCDSAILDAADNVFARGNVVIRQTDSTSIFADSVTFKGAARTADLFGDVVLVSGTKKLFTSKLNYDLNRKIAIYNTKATMTDARTQLTSRRGQFNVATNEAFFKDQVLVVDKDFDLKTDTLKFDTKRNIATFLAPTLIYLRDSAQFYTEQGFYDLDNDKAEFRQTPQYKKHLNIATADTMLYNGKTSLVTLIGNAQTQDSTRRASANTIRYNRKTEDSQLEGNAHFVDSSQNIAADTILYSASSKTYATRGPSTIVNGSQILKADLVDFDSKDSVGVARGNVFWQDTAQKTSLRCQTMAYNQRTDYIKASGGRPILTTLQDKDTLWLRADTIITFKPNPKDSARSLVAYRKVRMFKSNFQSVCDSLTYAQSDSLFRLFREPVIWSDTSQLTADSMRMLLKDKRLDRVFMRQNAFIINSKDELFYNQIKGRDITADFDTTGNLRQMHVEGNAESIYYAVDEAGGYIGVNKMLCSSMLVFFGNNQVDGIKFYKQPKATMTPMKQADHNALRLKGFGWQNERRPKSRKDL